jgi:hypothetical protein
MRLRLKLAAVLLAVGTVLSLLFIVPFFSELPQVEWSKTITANNNKQGYNANCMIQTNDGGYAIAGSKEVLARFDWIGEAAALIKLDSAGNVQWIKSYDDQRYSVPFVIQTADSGFVMVFLAHEVSLIKTDSQGNIEWNNTINGFVWVTYDGTNQTSDGGYLLTGNAQDETSLNSWFYKFDANGHLVWNQTFINIKNEDLDVNANILLESDGGYLVGGSWNYDAWLSKYDYNGALLWNQTYKLNSVKGAHVSSVLQTIDGGYVLAGWADNCFLIKVNSQGDLEWKQTYFPGYFTSIAKTNDGLGYLVLSTNAISKIDVYGNLLKTEKTSDSSQTYETIIKSSDGGYVTLGREKHDILLAKYYPDLPLAAIIAITVAIVTVSLSGVFVIIRLNRKDKRKKANNPPNQDSITRLCVRGKCKYSSVNP